MPRYVQDGIRKAAASLQFSAQHTVDYDFRSFSTSACVAVIYQITLREEPREVTLLCKVPPADADDTVLALFEREVFVYQQLLPTFVQFQQEHDILPSAEEYIYGPACYYGHFNFQRREGLLILEDVGRRLFGNRNKFEPIDYDSGRLAMVQLGRFHAVSLALKEQHPELFARFQQLGDVSRDQVADMEGFRDTMNTSFDQAIDTLNIHETVKKEKLTKLKDSFVEELKIIADSELSEPFCVVCHGDFSACNLMYSYNVSQHQPAPNPSLIPPQNSSRVASRTDSSCWTGNWPSTARRPSTFCTLCSSVRTSPSGGTTTITCSRRTTTRCAIIWSGWAGTTRRNGSR